MENRNPIIKGVCILILCILLLLTGAIVYTNYGLPLNLIILSFLYLITIIVYLYYDRGKKYKLSDLEGITGRYLWKKSQRGMILMVEYLDEDGEFMYRNATIFEQKVLTYLKII